MKELTNLTRRKVLGSIGAIGAGAALGGAGTMAFFSDEETFTNNQLVAGSLDMKVDWQEAYNGEKVEAFPERDGDKDQDGPYSLETILDEPELVGLDGTATTDELRQAYKDQFADVPQDLAERKPVIHLEDVKPGDWGEVTFSLHLFDNPGYVWLLSDLVENVENGLTEPERAVDGNEGGELADAIQAVVWHDDGDNVREDEETIAVGKPANVDDDIVYTKEEALIASGSLAEVLDQLDGKTPLDANVLTEERDCLPNSTTRYVGFKWWLPSSVGNEVQTDSVTFDLGFYTEQCRHNDGVYEIEGETGSGDFSPISYDKALSMQALSRAGSGRGEIQIHGDSGGVEDTQVFGNATFPADTDVPFTATIDPGAETASLTVNDRTVTDTDVTDGTANGASTADPEWPGGVPSELDVALTAKSGTSAVTTVVKDVTVDGTPVAPGSITAQDGLTYLNVTDIAASGPVTVAGVLRFEGATSDFDGTTFVGIDWR